MGIGVRKVEEVGVLEGFEKLVALEGDVFVFFRATMLFAFIKKISEIKSFATYFLDDGWWLAIPGLEL